MGMTLSIMGLYNSDPTIFDLMVLPADLETDRQTIIDSILLEDAELEILYPQPAIMKTAIQLWSKAEQPTWARMTAALAEQYNPLWNVDATITETGSNTTNKSGSDERTESESSTGDSTTDQTSTGSSTTIEGSTAFNSGAYTDRDSTAITTGGTEGSTVEASNSRELTEERGWTETGSGSDTRSIRRTGNIGVTSSQQLIEQEIEVAKYNILRYIIDSFKFRFCLLVY